MIMIFTIVQAAQTKERITSLAAAYDIVKIVPKPTKYLKMYDSFNRIE